MDQHKPEQPLKLYTFDQVQHRSGLPEIGLDNNLLRVFHPDVYRQKSFSLMGYADRVHMQQNLWLTLSLFCRMEPELLAEG